jgi:2-polyprenyl-3-methyl-5-hydroxy-6-metoxy-1,4-benzoquinol methylase
MSIQPAVERMIAVGYGLTYDAIVRGFGPYEALIDEVVALVGLGAQPGAPATTRVLDVSCGIGTVAARLARRGWTVVGLDAVAHLVTVARRHHGDSGLSLSFHHADLARDPLPTAGSFDVLVSMHTLYWHPDPIGLLQGCRRALKPGGHAIFLTYARPAHVVATFRQVRGRDGLLAALRALRWLLPTAVFERFRDYEPHYMTPDEFHRTLAAAGFDVLESTQTFLAGISLLAWTQAKPTAQ